MTVVVTTELGDNPSDQVRTDPGSDRYLKQTDSHAQCSIRFDLQWQSEQVRHTDCLVVLKLNLWCDTFPPELKSRLMTRPVGYVLEHTFGVGELIEAYNPCDCFEVPHKAFNRQHHRGIFVDPRAGRFYPKGFIGGVRGIFPQDVTPFRIAKSDEQLTVDLNHPLAAREMTLKATILDVWAASEEHVGSCQHIVERVTIGGPGMQARWQGQPTDFWSDIPFMRFAPEPDETFYAKPRLVNHLDDAALKLVTGLYQKLIPKGGKVLDLMTSWNSHLPSSLELQSVVGLGMNQEEMDANPLLSENRVHDLNLQPTLPYDDNRFDAVICTVSVEYLIKPIEVFAEVNRILKPGGRFIVTFSNRWFPPKVIRIWQGTHEFERMGLVLEYFHLAGGFTQLETWSLRGLPRPADDKYAGQIAASDPVYAVWGQKG